MGRKEVTDINRDFLKQIMTADVTKGSYPSPFDSTVDVRGFIHSLENHSLENHSFINRTILRRSTKCTAIKSSLFMTILC